ncbi:MBL fold metallo-hydrolase [Edaphobacter acidisoli]|nr:MBL fold metallo-hydrolase [Edaphobacter acidisoli]
MRQLARLARESHARPMTGTPQPAVLVGPDELGVTFIGHSSFMVQIGGRRVLIDPVFANHLILLRRQRRAGLRIDELPPIDIVLLTHAHMDHLNITSLRRIIRSTRRQTGQTPEVVVPEGVEDLVAGLGFRKVRRLAWWHMAEVQGLEITMTPCKHWGARMFRDTYRGYGGYVIRFGKQSVYHSGDTAYFTGFREIGERLTPRVALMPIGAYFPDSYRVVHTSPEDALRGFVEMDAERMVPMHFGTFQLGREPMDEPVKRLLEEAKRLGISQKIKVLEEGETMRVFPH